MSKEKKIYVVGIGPGSYEGMTGAAATALEKSDVIVGYTVYIDQFMNTRRSERMSRFSYM